MTKIKISALVHFEIISGVLLIISFMMAMCIANIDSLSESYKNFVFFPMSLGYGHLVYQVPLINLVNDGLMTLFFLLIGLELKFHLVCGEFKNRKTLILPAAAAIGGITVPALIYLFFNFGSPSIEGWAIPIATDTAFMLGILSFFGKLISVQSRAFIIGFSLIDDALALLILGIFYTESSDPMAILASAGLVVSLVVLNRRSVQSSSCYLLLGMALWITMVQGGIHGTLCGIVLALAIPVQINGVPNPSFHRLEKFLRPLVYFLILPLFAFINSGVDFENFSLKILTSNITLSIIVGLFIGKQLGLFLFSYGVIKKKWCYLPEQLSWAQFYAISVLGGVGFTLSFFIGDLTFEIAAPNYAMRAGVVIGSLLSACFGTAILVYLKNKKKN